MQCGITRVIHLCAHSELRVLVKSSELLTIEAIQHVKFLPGTSQSHLVVGSDGHFYSIKGNRAHEAADSILSILATKISKHIGVSCPEQIMIKITNNVADQVGCNLLDKRRNRRNDYLLHNRTLLGSRYPVNPNEIVMYDLFPKALMAKKVCNTGDFSRMLVIDAWFQSTRNRHVVFPKQPDGMYRAVMLNPGRESTIISGSNGSAYKDILFIHPECYMYGYSYLAQATNTILGMDRYSIEDFVAAIPHQWQQTYQPEIQAFVDTLIASQSNLKKRISAFCDPFRLKEETGLGAS